MTPRTRPRRPKASPPPPFPETGLAELGLAPGDVVRFRRRESERWKEGVVARRERDGSVGLHDARGAARSIGIELLEVRTRGPRGGTVWEPLRERAQRTEQIPLVRKPVEPRAGRRPSRRDEPAASPRGTGTTTPVGAAGTGTTGDGPPPGDVGRGVTGGEPNREPDREPGRERDVEHGDVEQLRLL